MNRQLECKEPPTSENAEAKKALSFVLIMGVVSLFADMTHEGARSITGPFLGSLGASAAVVGFVAGFGEFLGYAVRLFSGKLADSSKQYWLITIWGYIINLVAVPLLAFAENWQTAAFLMIMERTGRAIRNPARDVMLSNVARRIGRGWAFGIHEALDQIGAMSGPMIMAGVLAMKGEYRTGFAILLIPVVLGLASLAVARMTYPKPYVDGDAADQNGQGFSKRFWIYLLATSFVALGYADFPLIAFHFERVASVSTVWIPVFYGVAMGVDALAALIFGRFFDRKGLTVLVYATLMSALFAPMVFLGDFNLALLGMALWGVGMGAQESIMRAAIAEMVPMNRRGYAYGVFNSIYGICWFAGSAAMGAMYDFSLVAVIVFSVGVQLAAAPLFWAVGKMHESAHPE